MQDGIIQSLDEVKIPGMSFHLKTPPAIEPVSLPDLKLFARIDNVDEDELLKKFIGAAREGAELYTRRAFISQTWILSLDEWESSRIELPFPPLASISEVRLYADDGSYTTFDASSYWADTKSEPGNIVLIDAPPIPSRTFRGIEIEYEAGFGALPANVPMQIRMAITVWAAEMYEKRIPYAMPSSNVRKLLSAWKVETL